MKYGSAVIIKNKERQLLLQHRDVNAPTDKNTWAMWGGGKEGEETRLETAIRELNEELGIVVRENQLNFFKNFVISRDGINKKEVSVFELVDEDGFTYELHEGDGMRFFSKEEIDSLPLDFTAGIVLAEYLNIKLQSYEINYH
jgi:8-oxo-dGTP diphosphatase